MGSGLAAAALLAVGTASWAQTNNTAPTKAKAAPAKAKAAPATDFAAHNATMKRYCVGCHNDAAKAGNLTLASVDLAKINQNPELGEKLITKLRAGMMPPIGLPRPDAKASDGMASALERELNAAAAAHRSWCGGKLTSRRFSWKHLRNPAAFAALSGNYRRA